MDEFFAEVNKLKEAGESFAVATVIAVRGSASARPGSKAIINSSGRNIWGWVGGGCAETFVAENALEAMKEGQTRIIQADLDDEIFGLGMPCGGVMDVFIDPQHPPESLIVDGPSAQQKFIQALAKRCGFETHFTQDSPSSQQASREEAVLRLVQAISRHRGTSKDNLRNIKGIPLDGLRPRVKPVLPELLLVGSSRITEELALLGVLLSWPTRIYGWNLDARNYPEAASLELLDAGFSNFKVKRDSAVIIAAHHKGDPEFMAKSLDAGAGYIGLIASEKRSRLVFESLVSGSGRQSPRPAEDCLKIFAPSGLELHCRNPSEIALSCIAEIIELQREPHE